MNVVDRLSEIGDDDDLAELEELMSEPPGREDDDD
jgi:hypothetical protein